MSKDAWLKIGTEFEWIIGRKGVMVVVEVKEGGQISTK